jgi:hypothetical protein
LKIIFQDPTFSLQLLRTIGETYYKGADIGKCLSTAYYIKEGNFESWYTKWLKTAKRIHNMQTIAEFLLINPEDPRIQIT